MRNCRLGVFVARRIDARVRSQRLRRDAIECCSSGTSSASSLFVVVRGDRRKEQCVAVCVCARRTGRRLLYGHGDAVPRALGTCERRGSSSRTGLTAEGEGHDQSLLRRARESAHAHEPGRSSRFVQRVEWCDWNQGKEPAVIVYLPEAMYGDFEQIVARDSPTMRGRCHPNVCVDHYDYVDCMRTAHLARLRQRRRHRHLASSGIASRDPYFSRIPVGLRERFLLHAAQKPGLESNVFLHSRRDRPAGPRMRTCLSPD